MKEGTVILSVMYLCLGIYLILRIINVGGWDRAMELIMREIVIP